MSWYKLLHYDLRAGLFRKRNFFPVVLFLTLCFTYWATIHGYYERLTWVDYLIYCFKGTMPLIMVRSYAEFYLPVLWILVNGSILFLCLEYPLKDLTMEGQQIIVRSNTRIGWYLSKCCWILASSLLYFCCAILAAVIVCLLNGGTLEIKNTPEITKLYVNSLKPVEFSTLDVILAVILAPLTSLTALNMLQMTLCILTKPIYAFLINIILLMISAYYPSEFLLGNGTMIVRSDLVCNGETSISTVGVILFSIVVALVSVGIGVIKFRKFDILGVDE